jgi:hypothetical protein
MSPCQSKTCFSEFIKIPLPTLARKRHSIQLASKTIKKRQGSEFLKPCRYTMLVGAPGRTPPTGTHRMRSVDEINHLLMDVISLYKTMNGFSHSKLVAVFSP